MKEWHGFQIDAENVPEHRPGLYGIVHLSTDRWYIGISKDVYDRAMGHVRAARPVPDMPNVKLDRAFRKYGLCAFLFRPPAYSKAQELEWLAFAEERAIATFDAVRNGFNIIEASMGVGQYGEEFGRLLSDYWHDHPEANTARMQAAARTIRRRMLEDPAYRDKQREDARIGGLAGGKASGLKAQTDDEYVRRREVARVAVYNDATSGYQDHLKEGLEAAWADPVRKSKRVESLWGKDGVLRTKYADPEFRSKISRAASEKTKRDFEDPARHEKQRQGVRRAWEEHPRIWVTNGTQNKRVSADQVPPGFRPGRTFAYKDGVRGN